MNLNARKRQRASTGSFPCIPSSSISIEVSLFSMIPSRILRIMVLWISLCLCVVQMECSPQRDIPRSFLRHERQRHRSSHVFPTKDDVVEMALLSQLVYKYRGQNDCDSVSPENPILPSNVHCHFYHHDWIEGTQVLLVSNDEKSYVAIVFAGTDDLRTTLADGDIFMKPFGSDYNNSVFLPGRVHAGFDNNVFKHGIDKTIQQIVSQILEVKPNHRLLTTGHSLGAADAILVAADLVLTQNRKVTSVNFGCPRIGNYEFTKAMNALENLFVWRFVLGWDLVPRLPSYPFEHVGHTVQMYRNETKAYYQHFGNATLGYIGVPTGWGATPFLWVPGAISSHHIGMYLQHFQDPATYLALRQFETTSNAPVITDDDFPIDPPDDFVSPE